MDNLQPHYQNLAQITDVEITPEFIRYYPQGEACASITGYSVPAILAKKAIKTADTKHIVANYDGITGIEQYYDNILSGTSGSAQYQRNAKGRLIQQTSATAAIPGHDLVLSIDTKLQSIIHQHMQGHKGAVVVTNPINGEILAYNKIEPPVEEVPNEAPVE